MSDKTKKPSIEKKSLLTRFSELFANRDDKDDKHPHPSPFKKLAPLKFFINQKQFETRISDILSKQSVVSAGSVELINLKAIAEKFGDEWENFQKKAHLIVKDAIDRRLGENDIYTRYDAHHYILVFQGLEKKQAQLKVLLIAKEIAKRLLGHDDPSGLVVLKSLSMKGDGTAVFENVPSLKSLISKLEKPANFQKKEPAGKNYPYVFIPMWIVERHVVSTFSCLPLKKQADNTFDIGYDVLGINPSSDKILELDLMTIKRVQHELLTLSKNKIVAIISVPVHFETLANRKRQEQFINQCKIITENFYERIIFEVISLPAGIPDMRLAELVGPLKLISRSVLARLTIDNHKLTGYRTCRIHAVGFDLTDRKENEKQIIADMVKFIEAANKCSLKTYIHGVDTLSLATAAISCGFDYLDGHALALTTDQVNGFYKLELSDMYTKLL